MLAGNTSIVPAATSAPDPPQGRAGWVACWRLTSPELLHRVADPFFLDQANDVAVSVASMEALACRMPPCACRPVACDHLSYFRDPAGLDALAGVLSDGS